MFHKERRRRGSAKLRPPLPVGGTIFYSDHCQSQVHKFWTQTSCYHGKITASLASFQQQHTSWLFDLVLIFNLILLEKIINTFYVIIITEGQKSWKERRWKTTEMKCKVCVCVWMYGVRGREGDSPSTSISSGRAVSCQSCAVLTEPLLPPLITRSPPTIQEKAPFTFQSKSHLIFSVFKKKSQDDCGWLWIWASQSSCFLDFWL